jgi:hypothetical protein
MHRLCLPLLLLLVCTTPALANAGEEFITMQGKNGKVTFPHRKHQELNRGCRVCHSADQGVKIQNFGMAWAHKNCKGCHETLRRGPAQCSDCHKK